MLIPLESLTTGHEIRLPIGARGLSPWLDVVDIDVAKRLVTIDPTGNRQTQLIYQVPPTQKIDARSPINPARPAVAMMTGIPGDSQRTDFQNATLQGNEVVAYSIATFLDLPVHVANSEADTATFLSQTLEAIAEEARRDGITLHFDVQVGPDVAGEDEDDDERPRFPRSYSTAAVE